jgi:hypothetical protein
LDSRAANRVRRKATTPPMTMTIGAMFVFDLSHKVVKFVLVHVVVARSIVASSSSSIRQGTIRESMFCWFSTTKSNRKPTQTHKRNKQTLCAFALCKYTQIRTTTTNSPDDDLLGSLPPLPRYPPWRRRRSDRGTCVCVCVCVECDVDERFVLSCVRL